MAALSIYAQNKLIDFFLRAQTFSPPATVYVALFADQVGPDGRGTEIAAAGYARVAVTEGLLAWAGTQGPGSTTPSTGTSGETTNNAPIAFPAPTANWGTITSIGVYDAATLGNLLFYATLITPKVVNNGDPRPVIAANALSFELA